MNILKVNALHKLMSAVSINGRGNGKTVIYCAHVIGVVLVDEVEEYTVVTSTRSDINNIRLSLAKVASDLYKCKVEFTHYNSIKLDDKYVIKILTKSEYEQLNKVKRCL